jgi:hypothetical protein
MAGRWKALKIGYTMAIRGNFPPDNLAHVGFGGHTEVVNDLRRISRPLDSG